MANVTICDICGRIMAEDFDVAYINVCAPIEGKCCLRHRDLCIPCAEKILKDLDIFKEE
ncbi:MAG: hypothetical protein J6S67_07685 [Methanobrevibacter sp.]|nr:hypothetical protein [Methanobrevibacter sp.]